jgi:SAM-dependent methyltransferase
MNMTAFDEAERRIWDGRAAAYARSFADLCSHTVPALLEAAKVGPGARVLDVGTGTGTVAAAACRARAIVSAVDAEPDMTQWAAEAVPEADVRVAALPELPFVDGTFDAVLANFVLNHVGRPRTAAAELRRVTGDGGRVAVTLWGDERGAGQSLAGRAVAAAGLELPPPLPPIAPEDDFPRTAEGLAALLSDAGFTAVGCETVRFEHRVDPERWWAGTAGGVGPTGALLATQPQDVVDAVRKEFDALVQPLLGGDGLLVLPHVALLACGSA